MTRPDLSLLPTTIAAASQGGPSMGDFKIEAGVRVEIRRDGGEWQPFVTTRESRFELPIHQDRMSVTFERGPWQIRAKLRSIWIQRKPDRWHLLE